jgi:hypothetical protein
MRMEGINPHSAGISRRLSVYQDVSIRHRARGAGLLTHLDQPLGVEAELAALGENGTEGSEMVCWPLLSAVPRPQ